MLTPKQESFCIQVVETGNASEAYRRCYNTTKMNPDSVNRKAKELMDNVKIAARLSEMRAPALEKAQITLETHLRDLQILRDKADASEKYGPAVAAEISRGKASGLYVERVEHAGKIEITMTDEELDAKLAKLIANAAVIKS